MEILTFLELREFFFVYNQLIITDIQICHKIIQ